MIWQSRIETGQPKIKPSYDGDLTVDNGTTFKNGLQAWEGEREFVMMNTKMSRITGACGFHAAFRIRFFEGLEAVSIKLFAIACVFVLLMPADFPSFAAQWEQDETGWWYVYDDGTYPFSKWEYIDGNWYYFDENGYMAHDCWIGNYYVGSSGAMLTDTVTPDGYRVGPDGAWIMDSVVPDIDSPISEENILAIADAYDADGAFILRDGVNRGDSLLRWTSGSTSNAGAMDTCVHEQFHSYTLNNGSFDWLTGAFTAAYYVGSGQTIMMPELKSYRTEEWSSQIPSRLRTFRYDTYVQQGSNASANVIGAYGLLNEFSAYCWGMQNQINLFDYYNSQRFDLNTWGPFVVACENNWLAFLEFRYYILGYLRYARENYPEIWQETMNNQAFVNIYCLMERRFESLIAAYQVCQETILRRGTDLGIRVRFVDGMIYLERQGIGSTASGPEFRNLLIEEIASPELQGEEQELFSRSSIF